jgi:hypothetical protein
MEAFLMKGRESSFILSSGMLSERIKGQRGTRHSQRTRVKFSRVERHSMTDA